MPYMNKWDSIHKPSLFRENPPRCHPVPPFPAFSLKEVLSVAFEAMKENLTLKHYHNWGGQQLTTTFYDVHFVGKCRKMS